jgi:diguanylate cyclase (GGDEF)-like protein
MQQALKQTSPVLAIPEQVTVSVGVASWDGQSDAARQQLMETADRALYLAKQNGRNRVECLQLSTD